MFFPVYIDAKSIPKIWLEQNNAILGSYETTWKIQVKSTKKVTISVTVCTLF
jgi:hypothetical protein